ncbi:MFS transporter [Streptomyces sp. NPDC054835]|uniref:MFS transporter n=1 Tax=Streptomyces exfoliatus TaxID=1905 RepID=UPI0004677AAE|nr:MFS transporter [Streptomyces exfoliatus]
MSRKHVQPRPPAGRHARVPAFGPVRGVYVPRTADAGAFAMSTYGIPLLVLAVTGSAALTGLAFVLEWIPRLSAFALAGAAVDRVGSTKVLRIASVLRAVVVLAAAAVLPSVSGVGAIATVMVLAAVTGVLTEFSYIAAETAGAVASREAGAHAHRVQAVLLGIDQCATLAGPALAGVLLEYVGATGMLLTIAACSLLGAALAPRQRPVWPQDTPVPVAQGLRIGWRTLRSLPALAWLCVGLLLSNTAIGLVQAAGPVLVIQQMGGTSSQVGLVWSAAAVASLAMVAMARFAIDRVGLWPVGAAAAALASVTCLAVAAAHTYTAFLVLVALLMAGEAGMTVVLRTLRAHLVPAEVFGSTLSLIILLLLAPFPIAGAVVALTPPDLLGHVIGVCAVLQALGLATSFAKLRSHPAARRPATV